VNLCKDGKCSVYNNIEKQKECDYYTRSLVDVDREACIFCDQTNCWSREALKDAGCR